MAEKTRILVLVGGISGDSKNRLLFRLVEGLSNGAFRFQTFPIGELPFFSQDLEAHVPEAVVRLKEAVRQADGILFATPEYNGSYPGVLKNAIDWVSRPHDLQTWRGTLAAVMGIGAGRGGTAGAQSHLRDTLTILGVKVMRHPGIYFVLSRDLIEEERLSEHAARQARAFLLAFKEYIRKREPANRP